VAKAVFEPDDLLYRLLVRLLERAGHTAVRWTVTCDTDELMRSHEVAFVVYDSDFEDARSMALRDSVAQRGPEVIVLVGAATVWSRHSIGRIVAKATLVPDLGLQIQRALERAVVSDVASRS
jgi:DNA-binding NtrC family response regulator